MKQTVPLAAVTILALAGHAAADVLVVPAFDAATFLDATDDGSFESGTSGPLPSVSIRNFDSLNNAPVEISLLGFDTSGLLASDATINSVRFEYAVVGFTSGTTGVNVGSFGYVGGLPTSPNFATTSQGSFDPESLGQDALDLNSIANITAGTNNFFGLRLSGGTQANVQLGGPGAFTQGNIPRLVIDFTPVPEPTTAAALLLGVGGLALRRRRIAI